MVDAVHLYKSDTTARTTTSTSAIEITQYTVSWSDLTTAGFANADDVILNVRFILGNATKTESTAEIRIGSTFSGATVQETIIGSTNQAIASRAGRECGYLDRLTLNTNDNIYISLATDNVSNVADINDLCLFVFGLDDLAADDFRYAEDATADANVDASTYDGASITLPAASGDDWLILACTRWLIDGGDDQSQCGQKLSLGGTVQMSSTQEGEDVTEELSFPMVGYLPTAGVSAVCKVQYNGVASGTSDYDRSAIFALRMEYFTDHIGNYSSTVAEITALDTYTETNTADLSLTATGNVAYFASESADIQSLYSEAYHRVQADGTDFISTMGSVSHGAFDAAIILDVVSFGVKSLTAGTITIDVDGAIGGSNSSSSFDEHTLVAFSMDVAGSDTTPPNLTSPTGVSTSPTDASGTVSTDEPNGLLFVIATANSTENEAYMLANAVQIPVTAIGVQNVVSDGALTPGASYYIHYMHQDAALNNSTVTSSAQFTQQAAYAESAIYDGLAIPDDSLLYYSEGVHTGANNASALTTSETLTLDEYKDLTVVNVTDGSSAVITGNTAGANSVISGTLGGGTEDDWDNVVPDIYNVTATIDNPDVIYCQDVVTVASEVVIIKWYIFDNSTSAYSTTYTQTITATGASDGNYNVSLSVKGVPTLTLQSSGSSLTLFNNTNYTNILSGGFSE